jgi:mRNA interferase RelE/StbE
MKVAFSHDAERDIEKLTKAVVTRIFDKIEWFAEHFDSIDPLPLGAHLTGLYKLRVGDWRVIYEFDQTKNIILVVAVGHRSQVYR